MSIYFGQNLPKPSSEEVVEIGGRECFPQAGFLSSSCSPSARSVSVAPDRVSVCFKQGLSHLVLGQTYAAKGLEKQGRFNLKGRMTSFEKAQFKFLRALRKGEAKFVKGIRDFSKEKKILNQTENLLLEQDGPLSKILAAKQTKAREFIEGLERGDSTFSNFSQIASSLLAEIKPFEKGSSDNASFAKPTPSAAKKRKESSPVQETADRSRLFSQGLSSSSSSSRLPLDVLTSVATIEFESPPLVLASEAESSSTSSTSKKQKTNSDSSLEMDKPTKSNKKSTSLQHQALKQMGRLVKKLRKVEKMDAAAIEHQIESSQELFNRIEEPQFANTTHHSQAGWYNARLLEIYAKIKWVEAVRSFKTPENIEETRAWICESIQELSSKSEKLDVKSSKKNGRVLEEISRAKIIFEQLNKKPPSPIDWSEIFPNLGKKRKPKS